MYTVRYSDGYLMHFGVGHLNGGHSGRYPWGTGKEPGTGQLVKSGVSGMRKKYASQAEREARGKALHDQGDSIQTTEANNKARAVHVGTASTVAGFFGSVAGMTAVMGAAMSVDDIATGALGLAIGAPAAVFIPTILGGIISTAYTNKMNTRTAQDHADLNTYYEKNKNVQRRIVS